MGSRTQNHIIEEESRLFFRSLLPKVWVYRDKTEDYGIDSEVELFDENGNSTGLVFWVQLKGTASKDKKVIQQFSFKNEKLDQFKDYDIPVLIVRYSSINKTIHFRWAKSIYQLNRKASSTKIAFLEQDCWNDGTPKQLENYLRRQKAIDQGATRFPIKTFIHRRPVELDTSVPYSNLVLLKNYITNKPNYFSLTNDESDSLLQINIEQRQIVFSHTDLAFASLGMDFSKLSTKVDKNILNYILITFCASLFELGRRDLGSIVFFGEELFPVAKKVPSYLADLLPHLLAGPERTMTMRQLNEFLKEEQSDNFIESVANIFIATERDTFDEEQLSLVEEFLVQSLAQARKWDIEMAIGMSCYNLANFYRGIGHHRIAFGYYVKAGKNHPSYRNQAYYLHELAGQLFLLGRYRFAESVYRRALSLDPKSYMAKALIADCLLCSGQYALGVSQLDEYLTEEQESFENLDEWHLKYSCLNTLLLHDYPQKQKREPEKANLLAEKGEYDLALAADLLCPLAWYNSAVTHISEGNQESAFISFAMAGIICKNDISAWTGATMLAFNENIDKILLIHVIKTAHFYNGQHYVNAIYQALHKTTDEHRDIIMELLDKTLPKTQAKPSLIRFFQDEHTFLPIELKS